MTNHEWARNLVESKTVVFHVATQAAGRAAKYYDGKDEQFTSPVNGMPVPAPVLVLDSGHAVTAPDEGSLVALTEPEAAFYDGAQALLGVVLVNSVQLAAKARIPLATVAYLLVSMLRTQASVLEAQAALPPGES